jgi:hypothetical protein
MKSRAALRFAAAILCFTVILLSFTGNAYCQDKIKLKLDRTRLSKTVNINVEQLRHNFLPPTKTIVKVWDGKAQLGKEFFACREEVTISSETENLNWWIEWSTEEAGISSAIYQVSLFPFTANSSGDEIPGLMASGSIAQLPETGENSYFQIDLKSVLQGKATSNKSVKPGQLTIRQPMLNKKVVKRVTPSQDTTRARTDLKVTPVNPIYLRRMPGMENAIRPLISTLYIRIITMDSAGKVKGGPSKAAIIHFGTFHQDPVEYYGPPQGSQPAPNRNNACVRIVDYKRFHDYRSEWCYHFVVTRDVNLGFVQYKKGQKLYIPPKSEDKGLLDYIGDAVGSLVDLVESAVNYVSEAYAAVKEKALALAISLAKNTVGCGSECQLAFSLALDYGLTAMGMPPSIPNFDDFSNMGKDYLVKRIAEKTGLPEDAVRGGMDLFQQEIEKAAGGGGTGVDWLKFDPDYSYSDAILTVEVWNPSQEVTGGGHLTINQFYKLFYFEGNSNNKLIPLPPLQPGERLTIPVLLKPNSIQYTHSLDSMLQSEWNKLSDKGILLKVLSGSAYSYNRPFNDSRIVH